MQIYDRSYTISFAVNRRSGLSDLVENIFPPCRSVRPLVNFSIVPWHRAEVHAEYVAREVQAKQHWASHWVSLWPNAGSAEAVWSENWGVFQIAAFRTWQLPNVDATNHLGRRTM